MNPTRPSLVFSECRKRDKRVLTRQLKSTPVLRHCDSGVRTIDAPESDDDDLSGVGGPRLLEPFVGKHESKIPLQEHSSLAFRVPGTMRTVLAFRRLTAEHWRVPVRRIGVLVCIPGKVRGTSMTYWSTCSSLAIYMITYSYTWLLLLL